MSSPPRVWLWDNYIGLVDMIRVTEILGNIHSSRWASEAEQLNVRKIDVKEWTAQKSRFVAYDDFGEEYHFCLDRHTQLRDGDVVAFDKGANLITIINLRLQDIMVIDMEALLSQPLDVALSMAVEIGHALGNQHWAAVVRDTKIYVPLILDRKVMDSVMQSHHFDHISYTFRPANQVIPYLSPQEVRRLLGGAHGDKHHNAYHNSCHGKHHKG